MSSNENATEVEADSSKSAGNFLTRSKRFQSLVEYAFKICNSGEKDGEVNEAELYNAVLFIHLSLAKYCGPAACYPPTRQAVDEMFRAADKDNSKGIDKKEFKSIVVACASNILLRMLSYYAVLILLVPLLAQEFIDRFHIEEGSYYEAASEQAISLLFFFLAIPLIWNFVDKKSQDTASTVKLD